MKNCRAFTLVEALLTLSVYLLILTFVGALVSFGVRTFLRQNSQSDSQRELLIKIGNLCDKLRLSAAPSASLCYPTGADDLHFSFALPLDTHGQVVRDPAGQPIYQCYWIMYRRSSGSDLFQTRWPVATPSIDPPPPLTALQVQAAVTAQPGLKVLGEVKSFHALDLNSTTVLAIPQSAFRLCLKLTPPSAPVLDYTVCARFMR
ncbi:type II secretion system protein [bacterium]|nr:type II secretion system protein [bacterium]